MESIDDNQNQRQYEQDHDKIFETVRRETEESRKWDIALGCVMAVVILIDHKIFTLNGLIVCLFIQVIRYKIQVCDNIYMVTYRMTSMEDRMEYMNLAQYSRATLKFSIYLALIGLYFCIYTITLHSLVWLFIKLCVVLVTIFV